MSNLQDLPPNIVLIGMPGSGKSTVGRPLASQIGFGFIDTDHSIEHGEKKPLSAVLAGATRDDFLKLEARYVQQLDCENCVISTGGSVVYNEEGMAHLRALGMIIFLDIDLVTLEGRLDDLAARGVVIEPGHTIADLARERRPLYERYADLTIPCGNDLPESNAKRVIDAVRNSFPARLLRN